MNRTSRRQTDKPKDKVERADLESFPASDPPSFATPQPEEPGSSPQQADWKEGKAAGKKKAPKGTEEQRHQDQTAKH